MNEFARVTKHRSHFLQTKDDVDQLRRKMIATQVPNYAAVYPYVSNDLPAIEFRAPGAIARFKTDIRPYCGNHYDFIMDPRSKPRDVGNAIASMEWPHLDEIVDLSESASLATGETDLPASPAYPSPASLATGDAVDFASHPSVVEFKQKANLPMRFPAEIVAQQIYLSNTGVPVSEWTHLLGKNQTVIPMVPMDDAIYSIKSTL
jgi:hypothetical protein